jgi:hypothetical protein
VTTGLPEIDLYVSGTATEAPGAEAHFTERLGLVTGPAHAFNYEVDRVEPVTTWDREKLGLPAEGVVFVSAANYFKVIPEMRRVWARLLAAVPGSSLLLHPFNPNWSSHYPIRRFQAELEGVLADHGVAASRLAVSSHRLPTRNDVKALLAVGDVYLDTFPFGGVNSLIDPLELGLPVVVWEGATMRSRMGAALLRQLQLPELIASEEAAYLEIARRLAGDPAARTAVQEKVRTQMEAAPLFLDPLAASDLFGGLLETAFDELAAVGHEEFRRNETPLRSPAATPIDPAGRHAAGRAMLDAGRIDRGTDYLMAAVNGDSNNPEMWFDLAQGFRRRGQNSEAIQALEASLRIDPSRVPAWGMLVELAQNVGALDLAAEAQAVKDQLEAAADHPAG